MPLIDLQTNLKDLKYGHDEYKGGSSNQPFVKLKIPATPDPLPTNFSFSISGDNVVAGTTALVLSAAGGAYVGGVFGGGTTAALIGGGVTLAAAVLGAGVITGDLDFSSTSFKTPRAGTGGPDFLLRGGTLLPGIIANDVERIVKYFTTTSGFLFITKQNLLSRTGVKPIFDDRIINEGVYTPAGTISQTVLNTFGIHTNKQGLNPFDGINELISPTPGYYADNAPFLQNITDKYTPYFDKFGETPFQQYPQLYEYFNTYIKNPDGNNILSNRLVGLFATKILIDQKGNPNLFFDSPPEYFRLTSISSDTNQILKYSGGPGSILGVGNTIIRLATTNTKSPSRTNIITTYTLDSTQTSQLSDENEIVKSSYRDALDPNKKQATTLGVTAINPIALDFRKKLLYNDQNTPVITQSTIASLAPDYSGDKTLEIRTNLGDPGNVDRKNLISYTNGYSEEALGAASPNSFDKINVYPVYKSSKANTTLDGTPISGLNDLVQFRIGVIDNDLTSITNPDTGKQSQVYTKEYINFRAFLNNISDNYSSAWDETKYIGRGEKLYTYSGFDRKVSLSWTVAAQSKKELIPMYQKLNFLASVCAPDYSDRGYLRGNLVTLTIGGYFYEQPGIITGFSYEMNDDNATWEIGIDDIGEVDSDVKELPHLIKVTNFSFIPIHTFAPRLQQNTYDPKTGELKKFGKEKYISLNDDSKSSSYDNKRTYLKNPGNLLDIPDPNYLSFTDNYA